MSFFINPRYWLLSAGQRIQHGTALFCRTWLYLEIPNITRNNTQPVRVASCHACRPQKNRNFITRVRVAGHCTHKRDGHGFHAWTIFHISTMTPRIHAISATTQPRWECRAINPTNHSSLTRRHLLWQTDSTVCHMLSAALRLQLRSSLNLRRIPPYAKSTRDVYRQPCSQKQ